MARKKRRRPSDWSKMEERARLALERNKLLIESNPLGTPSDKPSDYRVGASVSSAGKSIRF